MARTSTYNPKVGDRICAEIADGSSLRTVCKANDMPDKKTVFRWLRSHPEFQKQYAIAKEESADAHVEDILDIADDGSNDWMEANERDNVGYKFNSESFQRSRLRVDARKWIACKLKPKKYGEKVDLTHASPDGGPVKHTVEWVSGAPAAPRKA